MKQLLIVLAMMGFLVGCKTTGQEIVLTREIPRVISVPNSLLVCPQVKKINIPDFNTATNQEVADFIALLYKYNRICGGNMELIKKYIAEAKKKYGQ